MKPQKNMDTIDKFVKQQLENRLNNVLNDVNTFLTNLDLKKINLSIREIYHNFNKVLYFNEYLEDINIELVKRYKTTINRFPKYFQKYCNVYSNYITGIITKYEENNKTLEEMSKEELIDLIRSKQ